MADIRCFHCTFIYKVRVLFGCLLFNFLLSACGGSSSGESSANIIDPPAHSDTKSFPSGIYESASAIRNPNTDIVASTPMSAGQDGVLVKINWNLCGGDLECLFDTIQLNLDSASSLGLKVALGVSDGNNIPQSVKNSCVTFEFEFRDTPSSLCLPWDENYLSAKRDLITQLGQRFDQHPALAYVYFVSSCTTNGLEGHCRINEEKFRQSGYTLQKLSAANITIMQAYIEHFQTTPIVFEVHAIFEQTSLWDDLWLAVGSSGRVGVAAWWCAERLSINGQETASVWPLVQKIADETFAICQTVGNFSNQPYRFTDLTLNLDYGEELDWNESDAEQAFRDTFDWLQGAAIHANQTETITPFSSVELWSQDLKNESFAERLANF